MAFFKDFKIFLLKGDIIALATAVVVGAAFNKIVSSVVADIIMPLIGVIMGGVDFSNQFIALDGEKYETLDAAREAEAAILTYGNVIQAIIYFIIVAFFIFLVLRAYEKTKTKKEAPKVTEPKGPSQEQLLTEIRDELRKRSS
ncbi:large conductance mechanosensitive channel protein MscL [Salinimicrobium terrae]|uniref:large conductance mechanosensitive channel protein MscL n=1 Tax=Salinimicrobium terrae TaxID=470866 RepID=UPI000429CA8A|nr:large conductance mechanosensitive channel protein MscL [Salinimicrobium terrae]